MTDDEALEKYGLPVDPMHRESLLLLLDEQRKEAEAGNEDADLLRCLCVQLFSIGDVRDSLVIWRVKSASFDLMCGMDVQFLCGAGLEPTRSYLGSLATKESGEALGYLDGCVASRDFEGWEPLQCVEYYRRYFGC